MDQNFKTICRGVEKLNSNKKIALSAFIGSNNIGDEAILMSILFSINKNIGNTSISIFTINPINTRKIIAALDTCMTLNDIQIINSKKIIKILKTIYECDVFICGGGGLLQDQSSMFNIPYHLWKVFIAKLFRKRIMFYAVGAGPIDTWIGKNMTRIAISMADIITVRDSESKKILTKLTRNCKNIIVSADPVINLPSSSNDLINIFNLEKIPLDKPLVGVCLRHWFDTYRYIPVNIVKKLNIQTKKDKIEYDKFVMNVARTLDAFLNDYDVNIVFIPFWTGRDDKIHRDIRNNMGNIHKTYNIIQSYTPDDIKGIISMLNIVIGMRLHSLILASTLHIPFVGIVYAPKVENFLEELLEDEELTKNLTVWADSLDVNQFKSKLDYLMSNHDKLKGVLIDRMNVICDFETENITNLQSIMVDNK